MQSLEIPNQFQDSAYNNFKTNKKISNSRLNNYKISSNLNETSIHESDLIENVSIESLKKMKIIDLNFANKEFINIIRTIFLTKINYFRDIIKDEIFEFLDLTKELNDSKKNKSINQLLHDVVNENQELKNQYSYFQRYIHDTEISFNDTIKKAKNENDLLKMEIFNLQQKLEKSDQDIKRYMDLNSNLNNEIIELHKQDFSSSTPIKLYDLNSSNNDHISEEKYIDNNFEDDYIKNDYIKNDYIENDYIENDYIENDYIENDYIEDEYSKKIDHEYSKKKDHEYMGLPENSWKNISNCIGINFNEESCNYTKIFNKISFLLIKCKINWDNFNNKRPIIPLDKIKSNKKNKIYQSICYLDCFDHANAIKIKEKIEEEKINSTQKFKVYFSKPSWEYNKI